MMLHLPNGIGGSLGDSLAVAEPLLVSGNVWYVSADTGVDAGSPAGQNREKPLATLSQAITNAADNDIIVLLSGHEETVTNVITIGEKLLIIGEGASGGLPTVKFTIDSAANSLFSVTGTNVELRNIWIEENAQANSVQKISVTGVDFRMVGCYLEANENDDDAILFLDTTAARCRIENCTFISTAEENTAQPHSAILTGGTLDDLNMNGVVISDGTVGWSNIWAFDASAAALTRFRCEGLSLLLGAEMRLHANSTGYLNPATVTGGGKVSW